MSSSRQFTQFAALCLCAFLGGFVANCSSSGPSTATATTPQEMILQFSGGAPTLSSRICGITTDDALNGSTGEQLYFYDEQGRLGRVEYYNPQVFPEGKTSEEKYVYDEMGNVQQVQRFDYVQLPGQDPIQTITFQSCE